MDNLRNSIIVYFSKLGADEVLNAKFNAFNDKSDYDFFKSCAKGMPQFLHNSNDDLENIYRKVKDDWMYSPFKSSGVQSPLYLLLHFTKQVLTEKNSEPYVIYHHLLKWRTLTFDLGEDLFSTAHLAYHDLIARRKRYNFSWRPVLFSDNNRLHEVLQQGVAENHSHLWASSLTFEISWMALMNRYADLEEKVKELLSEKSLEGLSNYNFQSKEQDFSVLLKKAVVIRFVLKLASDYKESENIQHDLISYLNEHLGFSVELLLKASNQYDSLEYLIHFSKILYLINQHAQRSLKLDHQGTYKSFDYAVSENLHPNNLDSCFYLYGERRILYDNFQLVYKSYEDGEYESLIEKLLHAYHLIKASFRKEIVLINKRLGFGNFKDYQDRKFSFIGDYSIYAMIFLRITLNYNRRLMNIVSNEYRISPSNSVEGWRKNITAILGQRMDVNTEMSCIIGFQNRIPLSLSRWQNHQIDGDKEMNELHFVVHFFKSKDVFYLKQNEKNNYLNEVLQSHYCRDRILRGIVEKNAKVMVAFRESAPNLARRITGIDAASSELVTRPEAFAQAFRFLKHHQLRDEHAFVKGLGTNNRLRVTFHAGEDFLDVVDGMRYLDECIRFLDMNHGDRFGHALALGIDVAKYYTLKQYKLMLPKHVLLDNLAWLLAKVRKFGLGNNVDEVYRLENIFKSLYSEIYLNSNVDARLNNIHYQQFYDAWKLRGDNPEIYKKAIEKYLEEELHEQKLLDLDSIFTTAINLTYWERCGLNECNPKLKQLRSRYEISRLYFEYHYNPKVKNRGSEMKQFEVTKSYVKLVEEIQIAMMHYVEERNLGIETNPTSNFLIGSIEKYAEHPILKWFNLGMHHDVEELEKSPQLSVSINTDDAGVFSTSLENEYALMAIALEKEKDDLGKPKYKSSMIYDWIDKVRRMGIEQSFNERP